MKLRPTPLTALYFVAAFSPQVMADETSIIDIFQSACLTTQHDPQAVSDAAETIDAKAEVNASPLGIVPPLMTVDTVARWESDDASAAGPVLLVAAEGLAMDQAAQGCLTMGYDGGGKISTVLDMFETVDRIDAEPGDSGLPFTYWLVDGQAGPAIFSAAAMPNPGEGPDAMALALLRVAPAVMDQLRAGL